MRLIGEGSECCGRLQRDPTPPADPHPCPLGPLPAALTVEAGRANQPEGLLLATLQGLQLPALPIKRGRYPVGLLT